MTFAARAPFPDSLISVHQAPSPKPLLRTPSTIPAHFCGLAPSVSTTLIMSFFWLHFCCWGCDKCGCASSLGKISFENALSTATHIQNFRFSRISFILPELVALYNFGSPLDSPDFLPKGKVPSTWVSVYVCACVSARQWVSSLSLSAAPKSPVSSIRPTEWGMRVVFWCKLCKYYPCFSPKPHRVPLHRPPPACLLLYYAGVGVVAVVVVVVAAGACGFVFAAS